MNASTPAAPRLARPALTLLLAIMLAVLAGGSLAAPGLAADPSAAPAASPAGSAAPGASLDPAVAMCQSASDLALYIGWLREQSPSEDGWLPVLVGVAAAVGEVRTLAGLVGETYRPIVTDLRTALDALRTSIRGLRDEGTVGSGIAELGASILALGTSMDALSTALREPCAAIAGASPLPALSPSPAA